MRATKKNALMSDAKVGIAFEYGRNSDKKALRNINSAIKRLLTHLGMADIRTKKSANKTKWFDVRSTVQKPKGAFLIKSVKNYKFIKKGSVYGMLGKTPITAQEDFYPILFGDKNYHDIFGFAARLYKIPDSK